MSSSFIHLLPRDIVSSGEDEEFNSNKPAETAGVIAVGIFIVVLVVLALVYTFVELCRISASEKRELRNIRASTERTKRASSPDPEVGSTCNRHPRQGTVMV